MSRTSVFILLPAAALVAVVGAGASDSPRQEVFASRAELVVLDVVVTNAHGAYVAGLTKDAFTVYEDQKRQPIELFSSDDVPATIGLLIDSSASMHSMRDLVVASAKAFAAISNPDDEIFALTFNEHVRPVLPAGTLFTNDPGLLGRSLYAAVQARGKTALHDALADGLSYLEQGGRSRKALVVVSDGSDNASASTFTAVAHAAAASQTIIYAIALLDPLSRDGRPDRLKELAALTGGTVQTPRDARAVPHALERVARDIRSSYTVGYLPPAAGGTVRRVQVVVRGTLDERLNARTRAEYARPQE